LCGIAVQYDDVDYSRRGHFGGSLVHNMFVMYSPDGINIYGSRDEKFEGRIGVVVKSCKIVILEGTSFSLVQTFLL